VVKIHTFKEKSIEKCVFFSFFVLRLGMPKTPVTKERVNVTLDSELVAEARRLGVTISQACEYGLRKIVEDCRKAEQEEAGKVRSSPASS